MLCAVAQIVTEEAPSQCVATSQFEPQTQFFSDVVTVVRACGYVLEIRKK